ncbi:hypothetical protein CPLU01_12286 [Colletotrichum plurivorum]|uniref:Uncharacterized protein n=1 Tax=Colletotrichum plurivorum TaxID=2175906 RepID=A0A8H6K0A4_9PEZI|nr:hypothetical protein CPLU01_12286 [Colletotrichum plurivorum]
MRVVCPLNAAEEKQWAGRMPSPPSHHVLAPPTADELQKRSFGALPPGTRRYDVDGSFAKKHARTKTPSDSPSSVPAALEDSRAQPRDPAGWRRKHELRLYPPILEETLWPQSTGYYTTPCNGLPPDYETLQGEVMHMQTPVEKVSLRPPQRTVSDVWHHVEP